MPLALYEQNKQHQNYHQWGSITEQMIPNGQHMMLAAHQICGDKHSAFEFLELSHGCQTPVLVLGSTDEGWWPATCIQPLTQTFSPEWQHHLTGTHFASIVNISLSGISQLTKKLSPCLEIGKHKTLVELNTGEYLDETLGFGFIILVWYGVEQQQFVKLANAWGKQGKSKHESIIQEW